MTAMNTGGYDVAFVVSDVEMTRLVKTLFLERPPTDGVPLGLEFPIHLEEPDDNGVVSSLDAFFIAHFELPTVSFFPRRETSDSLGQPVTEGAPNSLGIRLEFSQSALRRDGTGLLAGIFNLKGATSLIIPLGYLPNDDGESFFGLDLENTRVWLSLADDDPDPEDLLSRTSLQKIVDAFGFMGRRWDANTQSEIEAQMAIQIRSSPMMIDISSILEKVAPACAADDRRGVPLVPRLAPPTEVLCMDFETFWLKDIGLSFLALKLKLAPETMNAGLDPNTNAIGISWLGDHENLAILISNDFLLNHLLAPELVNGLLEDEHGRRDVEMTELAEEFFRAPFNLLRPIPMRLKELPWADEDSEDPNAFIENITLAVVPDPGSNDNMIQVTLMVTGGAPLHATPDAYSEYYTFDATIRVNIRFKTSGGDINIETKTDDSTDITVNVAPFANVIVDQIVQYLKGHFAPLLAAPFLLGLGGLFLFDLLAGFLAHDQVLAGVDKKLPEVSVDTDAWEEKVGPFLLSNASLDDLILRGMLNPNESASVSYEGQALEARGTLRLNLEADRNDLPQLLGDDPEMHDAITGVREQAASVICEGTSVRPVNGTRLHHFGSRRLWRAKAIKQADLRNVDYNIQDEVGFASSETDLSVQVFGVKTQLGRFALLVLWRPASDRISCYYRRYEQSLPGAEFVRHLAAGPDCDAGEISGTQIPVPASSAGLAVGGDFGGSIFVGYQVFNCVTRGKLEARPIHLRWPLEFFWTVITNDGVRHDISESPTSINVSVEPSDPPTIAGFQVTSQEESPVTFTLSGAGNRFCSFETQRGLSGMFMIGVRVVERGDQTFELPPEIVKFLGKDGRRIGFDKFKRFIDQLRRGVTDPSTWVNVTPTVPVLGPDPTVEGPDLRDQLFGESWIVPGVTDPPDRAPLFGGDLGESWVLRDLRAEPNLFQRKATGQDREIISKETLLKSTRKSFLELPKDLRAHASVKRYIANVLKLVSALPDPPDLGHPRHESPVKKKRT